MKNLSPRLIFLGGVALLITVWMGVFVTKNIQKSKAAQTKVNITMFPKTVTLAAGEEKIINVYISSAEVGKKISGYDVTLGSSGPFEIVDISPPTTPSNNGSIYTQMIQTIGVNSRVAYVTQGANEDQLASSIKIDVKIRGIAGRDTNNGKLTVDDTKTEVVGNVEGSVYELGTVEEAQVTLSGVSPTCIPRPPCLDEADISCKPPEPEDGYCPQGYTLDASPSNVIRMPVSEPNTGYGIMAILKKDGKVVTDQRDVTYEWNILDKSIASISPFAGCTHGIIIPCPEDHVNITALKNGTTTINVRVINNTTKQELANTKFQLIVEPGPTPTCDPRKVGGCGLIATPACKPKPTCNPNLDMVCQDPTPPPGGWCGEPTPQAGNTSLKMKLRFQGIVSKPKNEFNIMRVKLTVVNEVTSQTVNTYGNFVANENGIWEGVTSFNLPTNSDSPASQTFKILVKGPKHLQKKICDLNPKETFPGTYRCTKGNINLKLGGNTADLSGIYQLVVDLPEQDGIVNAFDTSLVLNSIGKTDANSLRIADLNLDGIVNFQDFSLVIAALSVRSDEE